MLVYYSDACKRVLMMLCHVKCLLVANAGSSIIDCAVGNADEKVDFSEKFITLCYGVEQNYFFILDKAVFDEANIMGLIFRS